MQSGDVGVKSPKLPSSGINDLHAQRAEGGESGAGQSSKPRAAREVRAEEQHVRDRAERSTSVSTWTSELPVELAKTLPKPRHHTAKTA